VPGFKKVIPNLGLKREGMVGDLIIAFEIDFTKEYSKEVIQKLKELL
jgi:DnaJ-class molecular chaperone